MFKSIYVYLNTKFKNKGIYLSHDELVKLVNQYINENNLQDKTSRDVFTHITSNFSLILSLLLTILTNEQDKQIVRELQEIEFNNLCNQFAQMQDNIKNNNNDLDI